MKVKISKTGEIKAVNHGQVLVHFSDGTTKAYKSISELSNDLSDYEEPVKPYWCVNDLNGTPMHNDLLQVCSKDDFRDWAEQRKQIGNYFETKEEAEKAVEKLKAWERLKDKGFRFVYHQTIGEYGSVSFRLDFPATKRVERDICLLFGGEYDN